MTAESTGALGPSPLARRVAVAVLGVLRSLPRLVLIALLRVYQTVISPMTGPTCRYYPSCSHYALVAVQRHGAVRGTWLAGRRLLRCHPWAAGGVDDVPPTRHSPTCADEHVTDRARSSS